jgi:hypothetical protein
MGCIYTFQRFPGQRAIHAHGFYLGDAKITATDMSGNREVKILNLKTGLITDIKPPLHHPTPPQQ